MISTQIKNRAIFFILFLLFSIKVSAQTGDKLTDGIYYLANYLASPQISELKENNQDLAILDSLYKKAINYYKGDYSEALLALTFTTLPYNKMPLVTPLFNIKFDLPLPSVIDSLYQLKNKNLPTNYYWLSSERDIDKTTHFFGNAFLANSVSIFNLSEYFGRMVELFEYTFAIGGHLDQRDLNVNKLGAYFGEEIKSNYNLLPSQIITVYNILTVYSNPLPN